MSDITLSILQFNCKRLERNLLRLREILVDLQSLGRLIENDRSYMETVLHRLKRDLQYEESKQECEIRNLKEEDAEVSFDTTD